MRNSINTQSKSIDRNEENRLPDLDFTDCIALIADSIEDIEALTTILEKAAAKVGLKTYQDKTKVMVIHQKDNIRNTNQFKLESKPGESVGKFKYLGSVSRANGNVVII